MSAETILIADDDSAIRTVISQALSRLGYDVRAAENATTLWRWIEEGDGDLVVTDAIMPDEDGLDLLPRILKVRPELRIIVMSAESTMIMALRATEQGAYEYLPKPFDLNELITVVQRALVEPNSNMVPIADSAAIDETVVERELNQSLTLDTTDRGRTETLSKSVERHLNRYFTAHGGNLPPAGLYSRILREVERPLISRVLSATRGNQIKAAEVLGVNRNTLRKKIRDLDIEVVRGLK